jgi:hypothetical protein
MLRVGRRLSAIYLLALFAAAAAAPHHHLDPIADILSDGPSNSGSFAQIREPVGLGAGFYPGGLVDDESCLACFHSDFVASPASSLALAKPLAPLAGRPAVRSDSTPSPLPSDASSRGPPALA